MNRNAAWYRQPILWLGGALFAATVAGCIALLVLASRYDDERLPEAAPTILKMPAERHPAERHDASKHREQRTPPEAAR